MKFQKAWVQSIKNDLTTLSLEEFDALDEKFTKILGAPNQKTKRIKGWKDNIRRVRFGDNRLLIYVSEKNLTIYALAFLPRKECYSTETKKIIEKLVQSITNS